MRAAPVGPRKGRAGPLVQAGVGRLSIVLLVASLLLLLTLPGSTSAAAPVSVGKLVTPGASAVVYGQGDQPIGDVPLDNGNLLYDDQISVELVNYNLQPVIAQVVAEEWTPGTVTVTVNQTSLNGTIVPVQEQISARLDPVWVNATLTAAGGGSSATVSLPLPYVSSDTPLEVSIGEASWQLVTLTPISSSLAGLYTTGGLNLVLAIEAIVVTGVIFGFLWGARRLARRAYRTPPVPKWWPAVWIIVPVLFYVFDFVPTNQVLGAVTPFAYPFFIGVAAFPYLPRLWRDFDWSRFQGIEPKNTIEGSSSEVILPTVSAKQGLSCVPETWRESFYTLWGVPLPQIRGTTLTLMGKPIRIQPRGLPVSNPLGAYYESDATRTFWYDANYPLIRVRHRMEWHRNVKVEKTAAGPDGRPTTVVLTKRRFSPHIVPGWMEGVFPPIRDILEHLASVHGLETESYDHEVDRVRIADLLGTRRRERREASDSALARYDEAIFEEERPRSREEIAELVRNGQADRRKSDVRNEGKSPG
jgi:hypothetical protein